MNFYIDLKVPICLPKSIDVLVKDASERILPGGQRIYIESQEGVDVEAVFGSEGLTAEALRDLEMLRGSQGLHMITFDDITCERQVDLFVYMPKVSRTYRGRGQDDHLYAENTILFRQVNPAFQFAQFNWFFFESAGYTVGDGKFYVKMPAAGRFLADTPYGISGRQFQIGFDNAGEQIAIQLRNLTHSYDYLTTTGKFKVDSGPNMEDHVLGAWDFLKGDVISLDIDQVGTGTPQPGDAILVVQAFTEIYGT